MKQTFGITFKKNFPYLFQLSQVEQAIQAAGDSDDLNQLKNDLQELISLTKGRHFAFCVPVNFPVSLGPRVTELSLAMKYATWPKWYLTI